MTFSKLSLLTASCALAAAGGVNAAVIAEAGGASNVDAQVIVASGNDTVTGGVTGDAIHIASGVVTTVINTDGNGARVTTTGAVAGNTFTLSTSTSTGTVVDPLALLFTDNTFTDSTGAPGADRDNGPAAYEEFTAADAVTVNAAGEINIQYNEAPGVDGDESITFGYDLLDVTNATRGDDWFQVTGLQAGSTLTATLVSDGATFGFFDGRIRLFDSGGVELANVDSDTGLVNNFFETASAAAGGDGVVFIQVTHSGDPLARAGGTYNLQIDSTPVPEPGSLALLGLGGLLIARRRRG